MKNTITEESDTYLSFWIENEMFGVKVIQVLEVLQKQPIMPVPNVPEHIKGIINFRGEIIPIFETRVKFNLPKRDEDKKFIIIVLEINNGTDTIIFGAIADRLSNVLHINIKDIKPVPKMDGTLSIEYFYGITKVNDNFLMLLDPAKLFSGESKAIIAELAENE